MGQAYSTFGQWVKIRRKQRGLTQKALGQLVGYAEITVRQIEGDSYKLTRFVVEHFVSCLVLEGDDHDTITRFALKQAPISVNSSSKDANYQPGTPFIGRQTELKQIVELLHNPDCRCISIVGVGGMGKTRLAARAFSAFSGDLFLETGFVNLTEATTTEQMARTIADAVGIALTPFRSSVDQVLQALAAKNMLLVLDNFEQLLPEGLVFLKAIVEQAPGIKLIVTSRERLQISSEWAIQLQGLGMTLESPLSDAVELFISTAQRQNHRFVPSEAEAIHAICRLLQGIPLALEMAASWTDVYTCAEILTSVTKRALNLTARYRDVDERHRSLQAVFETTWERLSPLEQLALRRLAVFHGGFTISAARQVTATNEKVLAFLQEKMLVQLQSDTRLVLHEMIRHLALQKLMQDEQAWHDTRLAHAEYFVQLFSKSADHIKYGDAREAIYHIRRELDNMTVAWNTLLEQRRTDWFDLCWEGIWLFFNVTSRFREGTDWFCAIVAAFAASTHTNEKHIADFSNILIASFMLRQGRVPEALTLLTSPEMDPIRTSADPADQYYFYLIQSYILHASGQGQEALSSVESGFHALNAMKPDIYQRTISYYQLGRVYHLIGNSQMSNQHLTECLRQFRKHKVGWGLGLILTELGLVAETNGQINDALDYYEAVLAAATEWQEVWNYQRTRISIGRVKLALGQIQEVVAIFYSTLQDLQNNPQIGLEIDCFVEIALVLQQFGDTSLAILLLEYCSKHPECFQSIRDRAADYLKKLTAESSDQHVSAARNLFPAQKREVAAMLLERLGQIKQKLPQN